MDAGDQMIRVMAKMELFILIFQTAYKDSEKLNVSDYGHWTPVSYTLEGDDRSCYCIFDTVDYCLMERFMVLSV